MEKKAKVSKKVLFAWPTRTIAISVTAVLLGYITYFATDFMGISAITAGTIFMISKVFDGFTDIVAGYVIDRTNSKLGKGRPYELAIIGYGISIVLIFCAPEMGLTASYVYLFVMYSLVNSIFLTLLNCCEPVYLANALKEKNHSVTILAATGFISLLFTMVASMILPQLVVTMGTTREGWRLLSLIIAIPCIFIGLIRFALVKEQKKEATAEVDKINVKDMLKLLGQNKYILLFSVIILVSNVGSALYAGVQTYYYLYILHDIGIGSIISLSMLMIIAVVILMPVLSKRFGFVNVIRVTTVLGMLGYLLRLFNTQSISLLFVSNVFATMGFYTMFSFAGAFVIDCMDYGEWKTKTRSEGTISCAQSVTAKIGTALGTGMIGLLMGISGYVGGTDVQTQSATVMIIMLNSVIPAIFCLAQLILLKFYNLDKMLPQIREDLKNGRYAE